MRFMMIVKADKDSEVGVPPSPELMTKMGKFFEQMPKAGVLPAAEGLQPSSKDARIKFSGGKRTVTDGPFTKTKEQLGGFNLIHARDLNEAIQVASKTAAARMCPHLV